MHSLAVRHGPTTRRVCGTCSVCTVCTRQDPMVCPWQQSAVYQGCHTTNLVREEDDWDIPCKQKIRRKDQTQRVLIYSLYDWTHLFHEHSFWAILSMVRTLPVGIIRSLQGEQTELESNKMTSSTWIFSRQSVLAKQSEGNFSNKQLQYLHNRSHHITTKQHSIA